MNLAIGSTPVQTWRVVRRHYTIAIAAVVVTAVAVGAIFLTLADSARSRDTATAGASRAVLAAALAKARPLSDIYYIVDSEEYGAVILRIAAEQAGALEGADIARHPIHVLVVRTQVDEEAIAALFSDAVVGDDGVQIVDLRPRLTVPVYPALDVPAFATEDIVQASPLFEAEVASSVQPSLGNESITEAVPVAAEESATEDARPLEAERSAGGVASNATGSPCDSAGLDEGTRQLLGAFFLCQ